MLATEIRKLLDEDRALRVGQPVRVRWGYGLGFRAEGRGRIAALYPKTVRVELLEGVPNPSGTGIGWPKGFVLKGIPRFSAFTRRWDRWNSVESLPEAVPAAG
jgi:hypothetical protein